MCRRNYLCLFFLAVCSYAQTSDPSHQAAAVNSAPGTKASEQPTEAFVVERNDMRLDFDNDGHETVTASQRIRINAEAGVQQWGILTFPYQNANQKIEIEYV